MPAFADYRTQSFRQRVIPTRFRLVFGMFLLSVLLYVDRVSISSAKSNIATDPNLSDTQMVWALSIFALA